MRTFNFRARNIGEEKYLSYTMGEDCELDEDVLDYCQDNAPEELIEIIYEEDDDYDYLTYPVTGKVSLETYIQQEHDCESVLLILRNVAQEMISLKEQAIPLSYVLLNRGFIYVDAEKKTVQFLCLPIESKGALSVEFKSFIRQLLANMKYDVEEDLNYVGKLLTYINGDNFNLRGLIGLAEALMEEEGISFEEAGAIDADGVEVVSAEEEAPAENIGDIMNSLQAEDDTPLPEIGDDEEEEAEEENDTPADEELDSILPAGMQVQEEAVTPEPEVVEAPESEAVEVPAPETVEASEPATEPEAEQVPQVEEPASKAEAPVEEQPKVSPETASILSQVKPEEQEENSVEKLQLKTSKKESDINLIKDRIKELVGEVPSAKPSMAPKKNIQTLEDLDNFLDSKPPVVKRNTVKVNRAAIIQQTEAELEAAEAEAEASEAEATETKEAEETATTGQTENIKVPVIEDIYDDMNIEKKDEDKKPKSTSILNKSVTELVKDAVGAVSAATTNTPKALPYLIRVSTEERIMLNKAVFKIGKATRGVDYTVGGNGAISRQHAFIIQKDGVCYIKDNKSTNHTYVNGKRVEDGAEEILTHDSLVRLGDEEFTFKIR